MSLKSAARRLKKLIRSDVVKHRGVTIPAKHLRLGGSHFLDDESFLHSGEREAMRLQGEFGLRRGSALLEISCGHGRLPIGILNTIGELRAYRGVDMSNVAVDWCKKNIEQKYPTFQFFHLNIKNDRYNPNGTESIKLPFPDQAFDVIYLYSVFSHMKTPDIRTYLTEFKRLLKSTGNIFLTAFIEENVPEMEENPSNYNQKWKGPLHCIRYNKTYFERLIGEFGFKIEKFKHGVETDGQSAIILVKSSS
ncbi:class I SAM-dependent methyltransferase [Patescibacteria group bacterium]|nr:class I SAM-dependent methyltransferase [Patescibacteria group bacterium]